MNENNIEVEITAPVEDAARWMPEAVAVGETQAVENHTAASEAERASGEYPALGLVAPEGDADPDVRFDRHETTPDTSLFETPGEPPAGTSAGSLAPASTDGLDTCAELQAITNKLEQDLNSYSSAFDEHLQNCPRCRDAGEIRGTR